MECFDCNDRCTIDMNAVTMFAIDLNKFSGRLIGRKLSFMTTFCGRTVFDYRRVSVRFFLSLVNLMNEFVLVY